MPFACPCCGFVTLDEEPPGAFQIRPVCYWEDDSVQFSEPSCRGGANKMSLNEARENFQKLRASDEEFRGAVRSPLPSEYPHKN